MSTWDASIATGRWDDCPNDPPLDITRILQNAMPSAGAEGRGSTTVDEEEQGSAVADEELTAEQTEALEQIDKLLHTRPKPLMRHVYLSIPSTQDPNNPIDLNYIVPQSHVTLQMLLNFDHAESSIALTARFADSETTLSMDEPQTKAKIVWLHFYIDAFDRNDNGAMTCHQVKMDDPLPPGLRGIRDFTRHCEGGHLYKFTLNYEKDKVVDEGIHDADWSHRPDCDNVVTALDKVLQSGCIEMYTICYTTDYAHNFELLTWFMNSQYDVPHREYYPKSDARVERGPIIQWGDVSYGPKVDKQVRHRAKNTFRTMDQYAIKLAYGVMRDATVTWEAIEKALRYPMKVAFVAFGNRKTEENLPKQYLAFIECADDDLLRSAFTVGEKVVLCFEKPDVESGRVPIGWQGEIKPELPGRDCPGSLLVHIYRRFDDKRAVNIQSHVSLSMPMNDTIYLYPEIDNVAPRRLVKCAATLRRTQCDDLKRYALGRDLRPGTSRGFLSDANNELLDKLQDFIKRLTVSQKNALAAFFETKQPFLFVQGPPGTGKTLFITVLIRILFALDCTVTAAAPSNAATDNLASMVEHEYPEVGAVRFHAWNTEQRNVRMGDPDAESEHDPRSEADPKAKPTAHAKKPSGPTEGKAQSSKDLKDKSEHDETEDEAVITWYSEMANLINNKDEWRDPKRARPNLGKMSLYVRALQLAGMTKGGPDIFEPDEGSDRFAAFRTAVKEGHAFLKDDNTKKTTAKQLESELLKATLETAYVIISTLSNTADNHLFDNYQPDVVITDEAANASELESLLPAVNAAQGAEMPFVVHVGDHKQLPPVVKSLGKRRGEEGFNPFAHQVKTTLMKRMDERGHKIFALTEQHRAVVGLEEVYNKIFYNGMITNAPGTALNERPGAQRALSYLQKHYNLRGNAPHVFLNVSKGKTMLVEGTKSRYNLYNIVVCIHEVKRIVKEGVWQQPEITIQTPYRAQAAEYRNALRRVELRQVKVSTTDSLQGGQNRCVLYDPVVANRRHGNVGFVRDPTRINVAISRAQDMFIIVADIRGLEWTKLELKRIENMDAEDRQAKEENQINYIGQLDQVYGFYRTKRVVKSIDPESPQFAMERELVNWQAALDFDEPQCNNCKQFGHVQSDCKNSYVPKCNKCKGIGHSQGDCPETICSNCGHKGHRFAECRNRRKARCAKCKSFEHTVFECTGPELRTCSKCNELGHIAPNCSIQGRMRPRGPHHAKPSQPADEDVADLTKPLALRKEIGHFAPEGKEKLDAQGLAIEPDPVDAIADNGTTDVGGTDKQDADDKSAGNAKSEAAEETAQGNTAIADLVWSDEEVEAKTEEEKAKCESGGGVEGKPAVEDDREDLETVNGDSGAATEQEYSDESAGGRSYEEK